MAIQHGTANNEAMKETAERIQMIHFEANDLLVKMMHYVKALIHIAGPLKFPGSSCQAEFLTIMV